MQFCRLGPLPRWHLQGLRAAGRQRLVSAALTALEATLRSMPTAVAHLEGRASSAVAAAVVAHVAATVAQEVLGRVPEQLVAQLQVDVARARRECVGAGSAQGARAVAAQHICISKSAKRSGEASRDAATVCPSSSWPSVHAAGTKHRP